MASSITREGLKQEVHDYWDARSCGTEVTERPKFSREYFDEIEAHRYATEPEIFAFAQFTRFHAQRVLEVGVGAGTDFVQWLRAGARAWGIDLTEEAIGHVKERLEVYGLEADELRVGDCESLPFADDSFDLVYSWGVIHHTPDTPRALREIVRVTRPGGACKVMIYNRHSLVAYRLWVRHCLLKGHPSRSLSWVLHHHMESTGTKGYTRREVEELLQALPVSEPRIRTAVTWHDTLGDLRGPVAHVMRAVARILGPDRAGLFMTIEFQKGA